MAMFALAAAMLLMAREDPKLWDVKLFEVLIQAVIMTGILNMVVSFHFTANKGEQEANVKRAENTGAAFAAISDTAKATIATASPPLGDQGAPDAIKSGDQVTITNDDAAETKKGK